MKAGVADLKRCGIRSAQHVTVAIALLIALFIALPFGML
jgi:hypothetical protein